MVLQPQAAAVHKLGGRQLSSAVLVSMRPGSACSSDRQRLSGLRLSTWSQHCVVIHEASLYCVQDSFGLQKWWGAVWGARPSRSCDAVARYSVSTALYQCLTHALQSKLLDWMTHFALYVH